MTEQGKKNNKLRLQRGFEVSAIHDLDKQDVHINSLQILKKIWWVIPVLVFILAGITFLFYTKQYYHADEAAYHSLESDDNVRVMQTEYGFLFHGPSETDALIFYPGGKVEEIAYAPLLHSLAGQGMDVCLVKMPFRLALFGVNKADQVMEEYDYDHWYIGGHSLGGVMAAEYAAKHSSKLSGIYMLAAYPVKPLSEKTKAVIIYGSEDGILNMKKMLCAKKYLPDESHEYVIEGGNHSQFGNYGSQDGDGIAGISSEEQQQKTVEIILQTR